MKVQEQVAALPFRTAKKSLIKILLVTSRGSGKWILPKGWPMKGKKPWVAAKIEALEEAGVEGKICRISIGSYSTKKLLDDGTIIQRRVTVFPLHVVELRGDWKEREERDRDWFSVKHASLLVTEPGLRSLLFEYSSSVGLRK